VDDGVIAHAVLPCARRDDGLIHRYKLACHSSWCKVTWQTAEASAKCLVGPRLVRETSANSG
jgi:hypothetical protein